jgi:hypothetical protein
MRFCTVIVPPQTAALIDRKTFPSWANEAELAGKKKSAAAAFPGLVGPVPFQTTLPTTDFSRL